MSILVSQTPVLLSIVPDVHAACLRIDPSAAAALLHNSHAPEGIRRYHVTTVEVMTGSIQV